jgi:Putative Actinobacterial Holin-X, holin superfamily III
VSRSSVASWSPRSFVALPGKNGKNGKNGKGGNGKPENFAAALTEVSERLTALVRDEIELARAEMTLKARSMARGAAAGAAGAVFGVFAVIFGLLTLAWGLNSLINSLWLGFLITFLVLTLLAVAAFLFAYRRLNVGAPTPTMAIDEAKKIRETVTVNSEVKS